MIEQWKLDMITDKGNRICCPMKLKLGWNFLLDFIGIEINRYGFCGKMLMSGIWKVLYYQCDIKKKDFWLGFEKIENCTALKSNLGHIRLS
jgi:hypothetical protein